jgi:lipid II:glycine glycyltransferase (peptidoglycan interpeptide bridge formation enzyme)
MGLKVADLQEQSAVNRKQLADTTREFKRSTAAAADNEYVQAVAALLKRYQEEIDALTRRAKHGGLLSQGCQVTVLGWLVLVQLQIGQMLPSVSGNSQPHHLRPWCLLQNPFCNEASSIHYRIERDN